MPASSRLDELYGADPRGRIKRRRSRAWMFWIGVALLGIAVTGYAARRELRPIVTAAGRYLFGQRFAGRVIDAATGAPLGEVRVTIAGTHFGLWGAPFNSRTITRSSITSSGGEFSLRARVTDWASASFAKPGYRDTVIKPEAPLHLRVAMTPR